MMLEGAADDLAAAATALILAAGAGAQVVDLTRLRSAVDNYLDLRARARREV